MGSSIPVVVGWMFVVVFAATAVIVLLDMVSLITIREAGQRKWLFRTLIGSIIVAIAGLGTSVINDMKSDRQPADDPKNVAAPANSQAAGEIDDPALNGSGTVEKANPALPSSDNGSQPGQDDHDPAAPSSASVKPEVAAWALQNLGKRPAIPPAFERQYPSCVAELQRLSFDAIDPADASDCRNQLDNHHMKYILGFYTLKTAYDKALKKQESALRRGGIGEDERDFYNFVVSENEDFNDPGGPTLTRKDDAEARLRADTTLCRTRRCKKES